MDILPVSAFAGKLVSLAKAHATPISTGAVILGIISAVVLAVKAGKESAEDIEEAKEELETDELSFGEIVRVTWKRFLPVTLILVLTISCLVVTTNKLMKRYAALSTAYALTESYMKDYIQTTQQEVGAKKEQLIRDRIMEKRVNEHPVAERGTIDTGNGDVLFYDSITTRYFHSSMAAVKEAEKTLAAIYQNEGELKLDEYTYTLGIGKYSTIGNYIGWKMSGNYDGTEKFRFEYSYGGHEKTGEPYCAIYFYDNMPTDLRCW